MIVAYQSFYATCSGCKVTGVRLQVLSIARWDAVAG